MTRTLEIPDLVASLLEVLARADGCTVEELVIRLLQAELDRREKPPDPTREGGPKVAP